jgi:hypothetical protein
VNKPEFFLEGQGNLDFIQHSEKLVRPFSASEHREVSSLEKNHIWNLCTSSAGNVWHTVKNLGRGSLLGD